MSRSKSMGHFIRKSVLESPIFVIDMNIFRRLQTLIGKNSNNLNQIAKRLMVHRDTVTRALEREGNGYLLTVEKERLVNGNFIDRIKVMLEHGGGVLQVDFGEMIVMDKGYPRKIIVFCSRYLVKRLNLSGYIQGKVENFIS